MSRSGFRPDGVLLALAIVCVACSQPNAESQRPAPFPTAVGVRAPEDLLRAELATWKDTPFLDGGTSKKGISNAAFASAVFHGAFGLDVPVTYDQLFRTGKLVERDALASGDLVFFETQGVGPFKSHWVGVLIDRKNGEVALASRELGVTTVRLSDARWNGLYKTARRLTGDPAATAPTFDLAKYGSDRAALLHDIAVAWTGVLYKQGGTTLQGIGNDEFVREVYGAIYETDLQGTPATWAKLGDAVIRDKLEPGDVILYQAVGLGSLVNQRHAGLYIGNQEFVHAVKGSGVTISKLDDPRWSSAFRAARRIDPDALERSEAAAAAAAEARAAATKTARGSASTPKSKAAAGSRNAPTTPVPTASTAARTDIERRLRAATDAWRGTPYKIGGTTKKGVDCSAFVRAIVQDVYKDELPRTAAEQEQLGIKVDRQHLQPGDLVFFRTQGMGPLFQSRHVGLYLGDGEFAQASGRHGVTVSRLDAYYWNKKYHSARRLPH